MDESDRMDIEAEAWSKLHPWEQAWIPGLKRNISVDKKLELILAWVNDVFSQRKRYNDSAAARRGSQVIDRQKLRELHTLLCDVMEARGLDPQREHVRASGYIRNIYSTRSVNLDKLLSYISERFSDDLDGANKDINVIEEFVMSCLLTSQEANRRHFKKLANKLANACLFACEEMYAYQKEHKQEEKIPYSLLEEFPDVPRKQYESYEDLLEAAIDIRTDIHTCNLTILNGARIVKAINRVLGDVAN